MATRTVFISHNKADAEAAREVAIFLAAEEMSVWFDEWSVQAGDSIVGRVEEGLKNCSHFLLLWSQSAAKSAWVQQELWAAIGKAIEDGMPRVIPLRLDATELPPLVRHLKYLRYQGGKEEDRCALVKEVVGREPSSSFLRAVVRKYHELVRDPARAETLGLAACPSCGSLKLAPGEDIEVDEDWGSDGEPQHTVARFRVVSCEECGWSKRDYDPDRA